MRTHEDTSIPSKDVDPFATPPAFPSFRVSVPLVDVRGFVTRSRSKYSRSTLSIQAQRMQRLGLQVRTSMTDAMTDAE